MNSAFSLYIDHQNVAELVRRLEGLVQSCSEEQSGEHLNHQIRIPLYEQFLASIHDLYLQQHPELKNEDGSIKLEALADLHQLCLQLPNIHGTLTPKPPQPSTKKNRRQSDRFSEVEAQLMEWVKQRGQSIYEKKDLDAKYHELLGDTRRCLTLKKIKELVERFGIPALIVRGRNKEEHFFGASVEGSDATVPKAEEGSVKIEEQFNDEDETRKNSFEPILKQDRQENKSYEGTSDEEEHTQRKFERPQYKQEAMEVMEEESCNNSISLQKRE